MFVHSSLVALCTLLWGWRARLFIQSGLCAVFFSFQFSHRDVCTQPRALSVCVVMATAVEALQFRQQSVHTPHYAAIPHFWQLADNFLSLRITLPSCEHEFKLLITAVLRFRSYQYCCLVTHRLVTCCLATGKADRLSRWAIPSPSDSDALYRIRIQTNM